MCFEHPTASLKIKGFESGAYGFAVMRFCLIFGAFLRELILSCGFAVLQSQAICGIQKIPVNFTEVCGFLILRCAVFVRNGFVVFACPLPNPPLRTTLLSLKSTLYLTITLRFSAIQTIYSLQTCCGIKAVFQRNSNNFYKQLYQSCFRFSLTFFFPFFFCKT